MRRPRPQRGGPRTRVPVVATAAEAGSRSKRPREGTGSGGPNEAALPSTDQRVETRVVA